jgi:hypothetical protein
MFGILLSNRHSSAGPAVRHPGVDAAGLAHPVSDISNNPPDTHFPRFASLNLGYNSLDAKRTCGAASMRMPILLVALVLAASLAVAQDIVGLEDCARATSPDKKIGCLQSNVAYLHGLIRKSEAATQARARDDAARLAAATARIDALAAELAGLKGRLDKLERPPAKK